MLTKLVSLSIILILMVATSVIYGSESATAQSIEKTDIDVSIPSSASVGAEVELSATITAGGQPVVGTEVQFLRFIEFMNAGSDLLIGAAITDSRGVATVAFAPTSEGELLITIDVLGDDLVRPAFTDSVINVATGPALYQEEAGISVPGLNVAWLAAVLATIWGIFMYVMFLIWRIASEGRLDPANPNSTNPTGEGND